MPGRITELSETQIIADLLHDRRRLAAAVTSVQMPQPAKDTFTVAATPATTYTLSAIPYQGTGGSSLTFSLNGVELIEGVDYTVDYTTASVTVSATLTGTPTPADVLTADYWTTGDLIAASGIVDTGLGVVQVAQGAVNTDLTFASPIAAGNYVVVVLGDRLVHAGQVQYGATLLPILNTPGSSYPVICGGVIASSGVSTFTTDSTAGRRVMFGIELSGVNATTPIARVTSPVAFASTTTTDARQEVVIAGLWDTNTTGTSTPSGYTDTPSGWTLVGTGWTADDPNGLGCAYLLSSTAGTAEHFPSSSGFAYNGSYVVVSS